MYLLFWTPCILFLFFFFFCFILPSRASNTRMNSNGCTNILDFLPVLGKEFSLLPLSIILAKGFLVIVFYRVDSISYKHFFYYFIFVIIIGIEFCCVWQRGNWEMAMWFFFSMLISITCLYTVYWLIVKYLTKPYCPRINLIWP